MSRIIVFGSNGALGSEIVDCLKDAGHQVVRATRKSGANSDLDTSQEDWASKLSPNLKFDGIVWAQGMNSSGTVLDTTDDELSAMFEANVAFVAKTIRQLNEHELISAPARGVVLSSIWQEHARANKFAYLVTKSALAGLVKSIAIDMAPFGFSINAVLPGVIDTPMTRANLTASQVSAIERDSNGNSLVSPTQLAEAVRYLVEPRAAGVSGQFLTVDNGWTTKRHV